MSKVYAIHTGCKFEGGGVREIYSDKENAIKFALMLVEQEKEQVIKIHEEDAPNWEWKEVPVFNHDGHIVKLWQNPVDEIIIYEFELK